MKSLSYLNKYFIKYKWRLLLGVFFIIGSNLFAVYMPLVVKKAVNDFQTNFSAKNWFQIAVYLGGLYLLLSVGKGVFLFFTRQTVIMVSRFIEYDLKNEIYAHYQKLSYNFYKRNSTGDLMNRISEDVTKVRSYLGPGIMYTLNLVMLFGLTLTFMLRESVELTLYTLAPLPIMSYLIFKVSELVNKQSEKVQRQQSYISSLVQESFSGISVLKTYNGLDKFRDKFNRNSDTYMNKQMGLVKIDAFFMPTITFLIGMSTILTIYYGGILSFDVQSGLTSGSIVAFIFYVNMLTWPFASLGVVTSMIQRAAASQERINEFLREKPEIVNPTEETFELKGEISFQNVSYTFPNSGIQAIKGLSFSVQPKETLAILGRTGSGKSTVINLLMRQFDPDEGTIEIDGIDLKKLNLSDFRKNTGVVPQNVFLFSDTIYNNVLFGLNENDGVLESDVIEALTTADVWHNIAEFKEGLQTMLGERGVNLSGGQKQRVSIARALIRKPKLLILDDCLSAVDTDTEEIILNNLSKTTKDSTTLIVSHRVSSIRNANHIIVLDEGKKVEEGTHEQLMALNGVYAEMYQRQLLEEQKSA